MSTYLSTILSAFTGAQAQLDAALVAAELDPLVDYYAGRPAEPRESNTPYAWVDLPLFSSADLAELELGDVAEFEVPVTVSLVLAGHDRAELLSLAAEVLPVAQATLEGLVRGATGYDVRAVGFTPVTYGVKNPNLRLFDILFIVRGDRELGSVS